MSPALPQILAKRLPHDVQALVDRLHTSAMEHELRLATIQMLANMAECMDPERLEVSVTDCTASRGDVVVKFSSKAISALHVLVENGGIVPVKAIKSAVYGVLAEKRSTNVIRVLVNEMRLKLLALNADIINHHGRGYRLELKPVKS